MALEEPELAYLGRACRQSRCCGTVRPHADGKLHAGVPRQNLDAESNAGRADNPVVLGLAAAECQAGLRGRPAVVDVPSNEDAPAGGGLAGPLAAGTVDVRV